jgi:hypothetical protein
MNNHINLRKSGLKSPQGEEMIPKMSWRLKTKKRNFKLK